MNIFQRRYETAKRNATSYDSETSSHRQFIGFCAAGNLSKSAANRYNTIKSVSHEKGMNAIYKKIMLDIFNLQIKRDWINPTTKEVWKNSEINWDGLDAILQSCSQWKYHNDENQYFQSSFTGVPLGEKLDAIKAFIIRYGTSLDRKVLIPKLEL